MGKIRLWFLERFLPGEFAKLEGEVDDEFRFHLEMKEASMVADGMRPDEARDHARKNFGDAERLRRAGVKTLSEARRRQRVLRLLDSFRQDLKDAFRQLRRRPGFALLAAGTLALGLSASAAVTTYVNAYSQPFPGADADDLFQVFQWAEQVPYGPLSYPDFLDVAEAGEATFEVAATGLPLFAASVRHETLTEVIFGQGVTGNFFRMAGVEMSLGRAFSEQDDEEGAERTTVISDRYWHRRYGGDPGVVGETILFNNRPHTIIGVAGPEFRGSMSAFRPDFWLPFGQFKRVYWARSDNEINREAGAVMPYLRVAEGADPALVEEALAVLARRLDVGAPLAERTRRFLLEPATWIQPGVRQAESPVTRVMLVAAACLLLLACANVANLVLSAGTRRYQEMALRSAMGASRGRLVRQLLAENLLLSLLAGGLALLLAAPAANRLSSYFARPSVWGTNVPREISLDLRILAYGFVAAVIAGVVTGVLPALRASGRSPAPALRAGGRWSSGAQGGRSRLRPKTRDLLVAVQIGLSVVLLFLSGLVLRSLDSARGVDPGFAAEQTLASYISTSSMGTPATEREAFFGDLIRRFDDMSWVRAAAVSEQAPLSGHPFAQLRPAGSDETVGAVIARVVPGYFEAMEMEVLQGRSLARADVGDAPGVVVVNEALAALLSGDGSPVGRQLWWPGGDGGEERAFEIVGLVRDARQTTLLGDPEPVAYFSLPQWDYSTGNAFLLKIAGDPAAAVHRMEEELRAVDPRIAIVNILPYSDVVGGFLYTQRMNAELFSIIAVLGLVLSAAGVFGVVSLAVAQRRKEIGIRLAIGADRAVITRLVLARMALAVGLGLATGLGGAFAATRVVEGLLWDVSPTDPVALGLGVSVLLGAVAASIALPVRKALRVDPVESLRIE